MVGADISLPIFVVAIHLLTRTQAEDPTKDTRMVRPRQSHYLRKAVD